MHPHTFLGIRLGTSCGSGNEIQKTWYLHSLPERPKLRRLLENKNNEKLFAEEALATLPPRAEKFGDLITADHKVFHEGCESGDNHRYAVVVQDLATRSYPCKTKTCQEREKSLRKFHEPSEKKEVIYTDNSWKFGKFCEDSSWNHRTSTPHRSETNGIAERAVRSIKEETAAVLLQSGLDEKWSAESLECYIAICELFKTAWQDGNTMKGDSENH